MLRGWRWHGGHGSGALERAWRSESHSQQKEEFNKKKNLSKRTLSHSTQARHRCELARASTITERKKTDNPREGWEDGTPPPHRDFNRLKERKKENRQPREGWENGTPPPHRDFKERSVMR